MGEIKTGEVHIARESYHENEKLVMMKDFFSIYAKKDM